MKSHLSHEDLQGAGESEDFQRPESNDGSAFNGSLVTIKRWASIFSVAIAATMLSGCRKSTDDKCLALNEEGKQEEAIGCYDRALELKPDDVSTLNKKGFVLYKQERLEEAIKLIDRALELKPDFADAWNNKGLVRYEEGQLEEYQENQILERQKEGDANKHHIQAQEKLAEAIVLFKKALELKPDYADALHNIGQVLADQGEPDEAIGYYDRALALKPDRAYIVCFHKCLVLQKQGKVGATIECYDQMSDLGPDNEYASMAWNNRGKVGSDNGVLEQALFCYDRALYFNRDNAQARHNKCSTLRRLGREHAAINCYRIYRSMTGGK